MKFEEITSALQKVIKDSALDFKHWWKYDFETDVAIESEADLVSGEYSEEDILDSKNDFIHDILDGFISEVCDLLGINHCTSVDSYHDRLLELIRDTVQSELQSIMYNL